MLDHQNPIAFRVAVISFSPSRFRRSITETIFPRRLITPSMIRERRARP